MPSLYEEMAHAAAAFTQPFDGSPAAPAPYRPTDWDVTILGHTATAIRPMNADHGADCAGPPATHVVARVQDTVFQCNGHIMTAINGGYGAVYLTPNALLDFSQGESVLRWDMSTLRTASRDWVDIVLMPYDENLQLNFQDVHTPQDAVHLELGGSDVFVPTVIRNYQTSTVSADTFHTWDMILANAGLAPSASRRDTFELRLSQSHIKLSFPGYNFTWIDTDISPPLTWNQAVVQLNHRSYNPEKSCNFDGTCSPNTWHWDNVTINPASPFTILRGDRRSVDATTSNQVNFGAPSPANARLRFAAAGGPTTYSIDGGQTWLTPTVQGRPSNKPEVGDAYWTPIPPGLSSVKFRGSDVGTIPWGVQDISIWAPGPQPNQNTAPALAAQSSAPTFPLTVTFDTAPVSGANLTGEYPSGAIDWGGDSWYVNAPGSGFASKSVRANNPDRHDETFAFVYPARLVRMDALNTASSASTVRLSCFGQPDVQASLAPGVVTQVVTGWSGSCSGVTVTTSNTWDTSFDNLVLDGGSGAPPTPVPTATTTPVPATVTPTAVPSGPQTVNFDNLSNPNRVLNGQYPTGVIDWGTNAWFLSGPTGNFSTNNVRFNSGASASFSFVSPRKLVRLDVYNGGLTPSVVSVTCPGQLPVTAALPAHQSATVNTGWNAACSSISLSGSNLSFDNLVVQ